MLSITEALRTERGQPPVPVIALNLRDVWLGMILKVFDPKKQALLQDPNGEILKVVMQADGTDTVRPYFYRLERSYNKGGNDDIVTLEQMEIPSDLLFYPTERFFPMFAPPNGTYAVFTEGRKLQFEFGFGGPVWGHTNAQGAFEPEYIPRNMKADQFVLPKSAVLIRLRSTWRPEIDAFWRAENQRDRNT